MKRKAVIMVEFEAEDYFNVQAKEDQIRGVLALLPTEFARVDILCIWRRLVEIAFQGGRQLVSQMKPSRGQRQMSGSPIGAAKKLDQPMGRLEGAGLSGRGHGPHTA